MRLTVAAKLRLIDQEELAVLRPTGRQTTSGATGVASFSSLSLSLSLSSLAAEIKLPNCLHAGRLLLRLFLQTRDLPPGGIKAMCEYFSEQWKLQLHYYSPVRVAETAFVSVYAAKYSSLVTTEVN